MKKTTRNYLFILLANALLVGLIGVVWQARLADAPAAAGPVLQGKFAEVKLLPDPKPLPQAHYLKDLKDKAFLPDLAGQWTIVNLWATWCAPCVLELPSLQKLSENYAGRGLRVIAISLDDAPNAGELEAGIAQAGLKDVAIARNWDDKGEVSDGLWPKGLPSTYIVDPQGRVVASFLGDADWVSADALALVESLLR